MIIKIAVLVWLLISYVAIDIAIKKMCDAINIKNIIHEYILSINVLLCFTVIFCYGLKFLLGINIY